MNDSTPLYETSLEKLEAKATYELDASRELVWRTYTDPALIAKWWGPAEYTTVVEEMDVSPGGMWRFIQHDKAGKTHPFSGKYLKVEKPSLLVHTFRYEPYTPPVTHTEIIEFIELSDERTKIITISNFKSLEDLELFARDGMEAGATESYQRQAQLVQTLKVKEGQ